MVFYHTLPRQALVKDLRTGIFRPMRFHAPEEIRVGETLVSPAGFVGPEFQPIAIADGPVYIGILPLAGPAIAESRRVRLQIQTASGSLAILFSVCEAWTRIPLSYMTQLIARMGFVFEIKPREDFADFADFRGWLADTRITDDMFSLTRETMLSRPGLELSASYSPFHSAFLHASINGEAVDGGGTCLAEETLGRVEEAELFANKAFCR